MPKCNERSPIFACAATAFGFKSLFEEIFRPEECTGAYILKGSCGSGKSSLIRRIASECEKRGEPYELYACALDPSSYDGIVLKNKRIYVIDGTPPHVTEPLYPGAVERVVDTSGGLDADAVALHRDRIIRLCKETRDGFSRAYSFLRGAYEMECGIVRLASENFRTAKMQAAISRFSRDYIPVGSGHIKRKCLTEVYCKDGLYKSDAFFERAENKCLVFDKWGTGRLFMEEVLCEAARKKQPAVISVSPLDLERVNAIYLPEISVAFCISDEPFERDVFFRVFNMARFTDKTSLADSGQKLRFMKKCFESLTEGATRGLLHAWQRHSELEKIYSADTDYTRNDVITQKLINEIFG